MATSSFNKHFVVTDTQVIERFKADEKNPQKITSINSKAVKEREELEGIQLLKQKSLKQKQLASTNY